MACLNNLLLGILLSKKKYRTLPVARRYFSAHLVQGRDRSGPRDAGDRSAFVYRAWQQR